MTDDLLSRKRAIKLILSRIEIWKREEMRPQARQL
jgi:hypothetical protein